MNLLLALVKKAVLVAAGETVRRTVIRWAKGELSLQDGYDRIWRRSRDSGSEHELPQAEEPDSAEPVPKQ
jgi:hypothetical protein